MDPACTYLLVCAGCDWRSSDDGLCLSCPRCGDDTLLRSEYAEQRFTVTPERSGIFRYGWLPVRREVEGSHRPAVYRSAGLGKALGLTDLWISFSGYWPERGCRMTSGSFKEFEAFAVLGRTPEQAGVMVIASAGNTAAAFAAARSEESLGCWWSRAGHCRPWRPPTRVRRTSRWSHSRTPPTTTRSTSAGS